MEKIEKTNLISPCPFFSLYSFSISRDASATATCPHDLGLLGEIKMNYRIVDNILAFKQVCHIPTASLLLKPQLYLSIRVFVRSIVSQLNFSYIAKHQVKIS